MLIVPLDMLIPVPPPKCALTSAALGPVYVITPVELLYANEPSPPASETLTADLALAFVKYKLVEPSVISSVLSLPATCESTYALTDCCDGSLVALFVDISSSSINAAVILASALAFVK